MTGSDQQAITRRNSNEPLFPVVSERAFRPLLSQRGICQYDQNQKNERRRKRYAPDEITVRPLMRRIFVTIPCNVLTCLGIHPHPSSKIFAQFGTSWPLREFQSSDCFLNN